MLGELLLAGRALAGALLAHVEAPVADLGRLVEEERGVGIFTVLQVGNTLGQVLSLEKLVETGETHHRNSRRSLRSSQGQRDLPPFHCWDK